jgi:hypothetical protein
MAGRDRGRRRRRLNWSALMSGHALSFSQREFRLSNANLWPSLSQRAQGKPGADRARRPMCESSERKHTSFRLQVQPGHPGFPRAMVLRAYTCSPRGSGLSCPRCRRIPAGVAPGSRRQDHTTSPYVAAFSSSEDSPDATTSIASRAQRVVTIAKRPSSGLGVLVIYFRFAEFSSGFLIRRIAD